MGCGRFLRLEWDCEGLGGESLGYEALAVL